LSVFCSLDRTEGVILVIDFLRNPSGKTWRAVKEVRSKAACSDVEVGICLLAGPRGFLRHNQFNEPIMTVSVTTTEPSTSTKEVESEHTRTEDTRYTTNLDLTGFTYGTIRKLTTMAMFNTVDTNDLIRKALRRTKGNHTHSARLLEISHRALLYKIKEYGMSIGFKWVESGPLVRSSYHAQRTGKAK
jgi:DNA-binding protein Fis